MRLGIDLDGCLANFNAAYAQRFRVRGYDMPWFTNPMEQPATWHYPEEIYGVPSEVVAEVWHSIREDPTFWQRLQTCVDDPEVFYTLDQLQWLGHEVYYLTNRPGRGAHAQTVSWLKAHGIAQPQVIITPRLKGELAYLLKLDMVVDDSPEMLEDYKRAQWEHGVGFGMGTAHYPQIYRVWRPYNSHVEDAPWGMSTVETVAQALERFGLTDREAAA